MVVKFFCFSEFFYSILPISVFLKYGKGSGIRNGSTRGETLIIARSLKSPLLPLISYAVFVYPLVDGLLQQIIQIVLHLKHRAIPKRYSHVPLRLLINEVRLVFFQKYAYWKNYRSVICHWNIVILRYIVISLL